MSVLARLKEIEMIISKPLLNVQDEVDSGLRALGGLRTLLSAQQGSEIDGLDELLRMIEERFQRANGMLEAMAYQTFGPRPATTPLAAL